MRRCGRFQWVIDIRGGLVGAVRGVRFSKRSYVVRFRCDRQARFNRSGTSFPTHSRASSTIGSERICSHRNSLVFLLTRLELQPRVDLHFGWRMHTLVRGIESYDREVIQTSSGPVERCVFNDLVIDDSGELRVEAKQPKFEFNDFDSYRSAVSGELRSIIENASAESRRRKFRPVSSISSGYDSPVGAVLAAQLGCTEGVTLVNARGGGDDSGEEVGKALGLKMSMYERPERVGTSGCPEAEFIATGMGGEDFIYLAFEQKLKDAIYVSGFSGDPTGQTDITPNNEIIRMDSSGSSLNEFRLRTAFIHFPVPFVGALDLARIREISNRDEMAPWTLGSGYDRPIPRRIVESAGVPRAAFGQSKKATSVLFHQDNALLSDEFNGCVEAHVRKGAGLGYRFLRLSYAARKRIFKDLRVTARRLKRLRLGFLAGFFERGAFRLIGDHRLFFHDHPRTFFEFRASLDILAPRYVRTNGTS